MAARDDAKALQRRSRPPRNLRIEGSRCATSAPLRRCGACSSGGGNWRGHPACEHTTTRLPEGRQEFPRRYSRRRLPWPSVPVGTIATWRSSKARLVPASRRVGWAPAPRPDRPFQDTRPSRDGPRPPDAGATTTVPPHAPAAEGGFVQLALPLAGGPRPSRSVLDGLRGLC